MEKKIAQIATTKAVGFMSLIKSVLDVCIYLRLNDGLKNSCSNKQLLKPAKPKLVLTYSSNAVLSITVKSYYNRQVVTGGSIVFFD